MSVCVCFGTALLWEPPWGLLLDVVVWQGGFGFVFWTWCSHGLLSPLASALLFCQGGHAPRLVLLGELTWCTHRAGRWCNPRDAVEVQVPCNPSSWYVLSAWHVHGLCFSPWQARSGGGCLLRVSDRESCRIPAGR